MDILKKIFKFIFKWIVKFIKFIPTLVTWFMESSQKEIDRQKNKSHYKK